MKKFDELDHPALAIVGIGSVFPKASNAQEYWRNIREGVDAITEVPETHWRPEDYFDKDKSAPDMTYGRRGGFIEPVDFDPLLYGMSPNNIEATDTTQLLGMHVAREALLDANYSTGKELGDGREFDRDRCSVIIGVTGTLELVIPLGARLGHPIWRQALKDSGVDDATTEEIVQRISDGYVPWQENSFPGLLGNVAAGRIANRFDLGGSNCVVDAACASSLSALHMAAMELYTNRADMVITGGFDTFNDIFMYMCFSKTPALSPTGNSRPFAKEGDGTILGEGLGAVVLKRLDDAERDNDQIYAVIRGIGSSSDGKGNAIYAPSSSGQAKCIKDAYAQANVSPDTIQMVEAHGTGTAVGDAVEATALSAVYQEAKDDESWCAVGSVKSMIGHTKAAAGAASLIKCALSLKHQTLPPTIKIDEPLELLNPGAAPIYVNTVKRPWVTDVEQPRRAAMSSFGFGGSNFHCVLEEYESVQAKTQWDDQVLLFAFSADDAQGLNKQLDELAKQTSWKGLRKLAAESREAFNASHVQRLCLVAEKDKADVQELAQQAKQVISGDKELQTLNGIAYARKNIEGKLAVLFPGQGSQYVGMQRDLACYFPEFMQALQDVNQACSKRLSDVIYPIPVFDKQAQDEQEEYLRQTQHAQPAIGTASVASYKLLQSFGLNADAVAGHSYGELVALYAAGKISEQDLYRLSQKRGELMGQGEGDRGSMLAVVASRETVEGILQENNLQLIIANHNAPEQVVVSGDTAQIEECAKLCKAQKLRAVKLPVAAAFHSEYVADAVPEFAEFINNINYNESTTSVFANTTAGLYPEDTASSKELLANQLANPVRFVEQIQAMYDDGARVFLEAGPHNRLSGLVKQILKDKNDILVVSLDNNAGKQHGLCDLAMLLAQTAVTGQAIDLNAWDEGYLQSLPVESSKPKMTMQITGANYVKPRDKKPSSDKKILMTENELKQLQSTMQDKTSNPTQAAPVANTNTVKPENQQGLLQTTQQSILALQTMQEQTARLHQQYLQGQETAQHAIHQLLQQQQQLMSGQVITPMVMPTITTQAPVASVVQQAPVMPEIKLAEQAVVPVAPTVTEQPKEIVETEHALHRENVNNLLLEVVSEKTGYPLEMLSLDMSLDTDLGIDSIKRVEILSALQERMPSAPSISPDELGTFQFLQHIVEFVADATATEQVSVVPIASSNVASSDFANALLNVVAEKTGYPLDMLSLDMNMDSDLGIDSIKRVEILSAMQDAMPDMPVVSPDEMGALQTLQEIVDLLASQAPASSPAVTNSTPSVDENVFATTLLEVVAEKTGYPQDMLSLEMNMDSDLGIDSIKRVEILSAMQDAMPDMPAVSPDEMGALQTLGEIVDLLGASQSSSVELINELTNTTSNNDDFAEDLLVVVADKTGYPEDMLTLDMNLDSDLGIDSIKRVEILSALQDKRPDMPAVSPDDLARLQTLHEIVDFMQSTNPTVSQSVEIETVQKIEEKKNTIQRSVVKAVALNQQRDDIVLPVGECLIINSGANYADELNSILQTEGLTSRVIDLSDIRLDENLNISAAIILAGDSFDSLQALTCLQTIKPKLADQALVTGVIELDGEFGIQGLSSEVNVEQTALSGLIKTLDKEWETCHCKIIDKASSASAQQLADEIFLAGELEVGLSAEKKISLVTEKQTLAKHEQPAISEGDLVVVTGGARGVTAEVAYQLASSWKSNLLLLGRSELPEQEATWSQGIEKEAELKQAIAKQHAGIKPPELQSKYNKLMAEREVRANLTRIQATGVQVEYASVDVRDTQAVSTAIGEAKTRLGDVKGIVHAAGVLADKLVVDKTAEQFTRVYETKVSGMQTLLNATQNDDLRFMVMFSSTTARLGRKGQCDYAAANEILNKIAQQENQARPNCRVVSVNWGPWDGGMVTAALKGLFAKEGVGLIDLQGGAQYLLDEIAQGDDTEIVILGSAEEYNNVDELEPIIQTNNKSALHIAFERKVSIKDHEFLNSHVMNHRAVLPVAIITEWLAHGAMHDNPGLQFHGLEDFRVLKGITLNNDEESDITIMAGIASRNGNYEVVPVELRSGNDLHAKANVLLVADYEAKPLPNLQEVQGEYPHKKKELYAEHRLFHGELLHGITKVTACNQEGIVAKVKAAGKPTEWMQQPIRSSWLAEPLILDASFQLMILWSHEVNNAPSLPTAIGSYRQYQRSFPKEGVSVVIKVIEQSQYKAIASIEFLDSDNKVIALIDNYECVIDGSLKQSFKKNKILENEKI